MTTHKLNKKAIAVTGLPEGATLTAEQQKQKDDWGWEFQDFGGVAEFSQVRTNMMKDKNYTPYCMICPGLQRFGRFNGKQMICPSCKTETTFPDDFIERYKSKHNLK